LAWESPTWTRVGLTRSVDETTAAALARSPSKSVCRYHFAIDSVRGCARHVVANRSAIIRVARRAAMCAAFRAAMTSKAFAVVIAACGASCEAEIRRDREE